MPKSQTTSSEHSVLITSTQLEQVADRGRDVVSLPERVSNEEGADVNFGGNSTLPAT